MSLATQISSLATRVATEFKTIRTLISGSGTGNISGLTTTDKSSLVAAINEVKATGGSGSSTLPTHTMASLVAAAGSSALVANQSYRITDLDMVATAKTTSTYFFDGTLKLDPLENPPAGYVGHISRVGNGQLTDSQIRARSFLRC